MFILKHKTEKNFYCNHIMNVICEVSDDKEKAKTFKSEEEAESFRISCEYNLKNFYPVMK